jgi:hypothetical protein
MKSDAGDDVEVDPTLVNLHKEGTREGEGTEARSWKVAIVIRALFP